MTGSAQAQFPVFRTRGLKRRGLSGMPYVSLGDGELIIQGGQQLRIPFAAVERAQIGMFSSGRKRRYSARLWVKGEDGAIEISPYSSDAVFAAAMRALAAAVIGRRGIGAVVGGMPFSRSALSLLLMTAVAAGLGAQAALLFRLGNWALLVLPMLGAVCMVPLYRQALNDGPRPIKALHELEPFLPQPPVHLSGQPRD